MPSVKARCCIVAHVAACRLTWLKCLVRWPNHVGFTLTMALPSSGQVSHQCASFPWQLGEITTIRKEKGGILHCVVKLQWNYNLIIWFLGIYTTWGLGRGRGPRQSSNCQSIYIRLLVWLWFFLKVDPNYLVIMFYYIAKKDSMLEINHKVETGLP